ncbi:hypothetical protein PNOK_m000137 (mitochondrion) [Pyrrhoderma noxium]|uniref:Uncharacterized protein n=1 Tax=Pyrrhoderma noxium TaxID=2282107 RepID=A0A541AXS3_9AGAM|nr:hypothetical protein PNOK_m000137 [Pyrrhoderma noxium]
MIISIGFLSKLSVATSLIVGRPCHFNIVFRCLAVSPWKVVNACLSKSTCSLVNVTLPSEFKFQSVPYGSGVSFANKSHILSYIELVFVPPPLLNTLKLNLLPLPPSLGYISVGYLYLSTWVL